MRDYNRMTFNLERKISSHATGIVLEDYKEIFDL
jgi:hypothetical protein